MLQKKTATPALERKPEAQPRASQGASTDMKLAGRSCDAARLALASLHGACGAFLIACARLYWYMEHPYLTYFVDLLAPEQNRHFTLIGTALGCIGALHALRAVELAIPRALRKRYHEWRFASKMATAATLPEVPFAATACHRVKVAWRQLFGRQGVFGDGSRHFQWMSVVMELVQIAAQVYQAHRSSHLISRVWINQCYVAIVVLYCWTTPLLHHFLQSSTSTKRITCLAVDALLNIAYSSILPLVIFIPYMYDYDPVAFSFSLPLLYGDETFGNLVLENQSIFAVSLLECGSKLIPHISAYLSLRTVGFLLQVQPSSSPANDASVAPSKVAATPGPSVQDLGETSASSRSWKLTIYSCVRFFYGCLGVAILGVHIAAVRRFDGVPALGCKQTMSPWFATKYSCSVFEFNCYRQNVSSPASSSLDFLDEQALTSLMIAHCPELVVPKSIQRFPNLLGIEIHNATIVEWSADAAISASLHPKMVFLLLNVVNMTSLPDGILEPLPEMLQDVEISVTNLTSLPGDLHKRWGSIGVLYLEYSELEVFPETLFRLEVYDLSLIGNRIQSIPELPTLQSNYYVLALSHNPLQTLPDVVPDGFSIDFLGLENTNLESLPAWTNANSVIKSQQHQATASSLVVNETREEAGGIH